MAFFISVSTSVSMIYGAVAGKNILEIKNVEICFKNLPASMDNLKIVQLSDIHLGSFNHSKHLLSEAENVIEKEKPNLILFTGDLVNNFAEETLGWDNYFRSITMHAPSYSILGNHDYGDYTTWENNTDKIENFGRIVESHKRFGFIILNNKNVKLKTGNDSIYIAGVENWGDPPFPQYAKLDSAMMNIPKGAFVILLSHDPAHWENIIKYRNDIDLTLSGHTHGFQWGISKAGIKFSLAWLARKNWSGLYQFNHSKLYVNTGLGAVAIPWRINMPPEITLITLKRMKID